MAECPPEEAAAQKGAPPALSEAPLPATRQRKKSLHPKQSKVKGLPIPPGVSFIYYGRPSKMMSRKFGAFGHLGVMTVAFRIVSPGVLHLAVACCSPKDPWCKVAGRDLALKRLYDDPIITPFLYEPWRIARQVAEALIKRDFAGLQNFGVTPCQNIERLVPGWAKKLANRLKAGKLRPSPKTILKKTLLEPQIVLKPDPANLARLEAQLEKLVLPFLKIPF